MYKYIKRCLFSLKYLRPKLSVSEDVEQWEISYTSANWYNPCGKCWAFSNKLKNMPTPYPTILILGTHK